MWKSRINLSWVLGGWVAHLVEWWWRRDRIRVSPREGRLLRLRPPCHLLIRGLAVEVLERANQPHGSSGRPSVVYSCWTASGPGELIVELSDISAACRVTWRQRGYVEILPEAEIEIYS